MDTLVERIRALRDELAELEQGLVTGPRPEALAWIELDSAGTVIEASPAAATRLGIDARSLAGSPLGMLGDFSGDPLSDGVVSIATAEGSAPVLSVATGDARTLVIGAAGSATASSGAAPSRKLVHDMSNVLGIMRGRAELVAMQSADEKIRSSMEEIQKAADRALEILDGARAPR